MWVELQLFCDKHELYDANFPYFHERFVKELLTPFITMWRDTLVSYHFFFEYDPDVVLRLKFGDGWIGRVARRTVLEDFDNRFKSMSPPLFALRRINENYDEEERYGTDGWRIAQKIFQAATDMAILRYTGTAGKLAHLGKYIHCICNPVLGPVHEELIFYVNRLLDHEAAVANEAGQIIGVMLPYPWAVETKVEDGGSGDVTRPQISRKFEESSK